MVTVTFTDQSDISRLHFNIPTQCFFRHESDDQVCAGILIDTNVICMCCGAFIPLDEVDYLKYNTEEWIDLSTEFYWSLADSIGEPEVDDNGE